MLTAWTVSAALRAYHLAGYPYITLEQPCPTLEETIALKTQLKVPVILDESAKDIPSIVDIAQRQAANVIQLKIGRFGGITQTKLVGINCSLYIEDI